MNTPTVMDEHPLPIQNTPGSQLARIREKKGFTVEYVAGKLNLRVKIIELLEADDYDHLPEPVFVKGYLRGYAKLLDISPEPYLAVFNSTCSQEKKSDRALWQSKRESNKGERIVRWVTAGVVVVALVAISFWWEKNRELSPSSSLANQQVQSTPTMAAKNDNLNAVSKLQSMFIKTNDEQRVENRGQ